MTKKVFVLGAGFSKAIEGAMPLTTELHTEVFRRLKDWEYFPKLEKINSKINGNNKDLEKLLSFLAEKQIWQGYAESNDYNTLYEELKEKISEVIEDKEREFKILEADDWILKLFLNIIGQNIDIITFNYDQLVEKIIYHFPTRDSKLFTQIVYTFESRRSIFSQHSLYYEIYNNHYSDEFAFTYTTQPISTPLNLNLCFNKLDFIRKALVYNCIPYKITPIGEGGYAIHKIPNEDINRTISCICPSYHSTFKKKNYESLLKSGFTEIANSIEKIADSFKEKLFDLDFIGKARYIYPIVQENFLKFPVNHIGDRMGLKEDRKIAVTEKSHQLHQHQAPERKVNVLLMNSHRFNLFKLHGSVNWYTKPNFGNYYYVPHYEDKGSYTTELKDLQRLIVPPVANKSNLYEDSLFGAIWKGAYEKLKQADEVYFLGYSLPETDLQAKYLFQTGIKKDAKIFVVNKKGEENKYKNTFAGFANLNVEYCKNYENPIKTFAENYEGFYG